MNGDLPVLLLFGITIIGLLFLIYLFSRRSPLFESFQQGGNLIDLATYMNSLTGAAINSAAYRNTQISIPDPDKGFAELRRRYGFSPTTPIAAWGDFWNGEGTSAPMNLLWDIPGNPPSQAELDSYRSSYLVFGNVDMRNTVGIPEVYAVGPGYQYTKAQAQAKCESLGARLATQAELTEAYNNRANWCFCAYVADSPTSQYTNNTDPVGGCGGPARGIKYCGNDPSLAGATCFGIKPIEGSANAAGIQPFNATQWSQYSVSNEVAVSSDNAQKVYFGSPDDMDNYLNVSYDAENTARVRHFSVREFLKAETTQTVVAGDFVVNLNRPNVDFNNARVANLTSHTLSLFSYPARNFLVTWFYNRMRRVIDFKYKANSQADITNRKNGVQYLIPPTYGIDLKDKKFLDSIAQGFYEFTDGVYSMTYIYDVYPLGASILDVRFDMTQHKGPSTIQPRIDALKARYYKLVRSNVPQNVIDKAKEDYTEAMDELQQTLSENVNATVKGQVARFFIKNNGSGTISIMGFTMNSKAVTSFMPALNGGLDTDAVVVISATQVDREQPGNLNYEPTTQYTRNPSETLVCSDPDTLRRIMDDYVDTFSDPELQLDADFVAPTPTWDQDGTLVVTEVNGTAQVSPYQCAVRWRETVFDEDGKPKSGLTDITRRAIFTYSPNTDDWFAKERVFDTSGVRFLTSDTIDACRWDPAGYRRKVGWRLNGATDAQAGEDWIATGRREGRSVCPNVNPGYRFDALGYVMAPSNGDLPGAFRGNEVFQGNAHFVNHNIRGNERRSVLDGRTITALNPVLSLPRPIPAEETLDDRNGVCPKTSCASLEVLYSLVDQYNNDPDAPGAILRVRRATTPNDSQCDVEVEVDYDAMIDGETQVIKITPDPNYTGPPLPSTRTVVQRIKKGAAKIPTGVTGVRTETRSFSVSLEPVDCSYSLDEAGDPGSGTSIVPNTPALYKPMEYATMVQEKNSSTFTKLMGEVATAAGTALDAARTAITGYRTNTYTALGDLNTLGDNCPNVRCSTPSILDKIIAYYAQQNSGARLSIANIMKVGTFNNRSCDITFDQKNLAAARVRFVRIDGGSEYLNLAQIVVRNTLGVNIARGKPATSFSVYNNLDGSRPNQLVTGIESNTGGAYHSGLAFSPNEFVEIDLGTPEIIQSITIYNRGDCCQDRLATYSLKTLDASRNVTRTIRLTRELIQTYNFGQTVTARFTMAPMAPPAQCDFTVTGVQVINQPAPWDTVRAVGSASAMTAAPMTKPASVNYVNPNKDAFVNYKREVSGQQIYETAEVAAPLGEGAFGLDRARNQVSFQLKDMYRAPLFQPKEVLEVANGGAPLVKRGAAHKSETPPVSAYKYIRFRPVKTRVAGAKSVAVGRFTFYYGDAEVDPRSAQVTNPMGGWLGEAADVLRAGGKGWDDEYKMPIVFAFPVPVKMDGFSWTTAIIPAAADPVRWKLEGSQNGTYWEVLHDQGATDFRVPAKRGADLPVFRFM